MIKSFCKKDYIQAGMLCFTIAFFSFIYFIIRGHGFLVLCNDFNDQQIPFTIGLHNGLLDGGLSGFSWDIDLGTSTLDGFSFYELGSPFFWASMVFPANTFPYIVGWMFMLKYSVAGITSCLYLRRFLSDRKWAVVGAVLYAFSGFSIVNLLFYHFHDAICFFPLLLIGLERFKEKKDYKFFVLSIFLNAVINYYFFVCEVVFLVVYYVFRFASGDKKEFAIDIFKCLACGICGVAMAAFILIPNIMFVSGNPRTESFQGFLKMLTMSKEQYLYIAKTMFLPGEALTTVSAVYSQMFTSHGFYLPMVGWGLVISYLIRKRDWLSGIIVFCIVASFVPLLSEGFFLFSSSQMRWWFMFTLMVALASTRVLEDPNGINIGIGTGIYIAIIFAISFVIYRLGLINDSQRFFALVGIAVFGSLLTYCYSVLGTIRLYSLMLVTISTFCIILMTLTIHTYRKAAWLDYDGYKQRYEAAKQIELPNEQYRLNDTMNLISMVAHVGGFTNQSSTDTNTIRDFEALFDFYDPVSAIPKNDIPGLAELLGGKYYLSFDSNGGNYIAEYYTSYGAMYLLEREACPIGYAVDSWISKDELMKLDVNLRAIALLDSVVLGDEAIETSIVDELPQMTASDINTFMPISDYVSQAIARAVNDFNKDGHGFTCSTSYENDTYVYFAVPYDKGWTATIDGDKTDIIVSGGMMIIKVPAGIHSIEFSYYTPGLKLGLIISLITMMTALGFCYVQKKTK